MISTERVFYFLVGVFILLLLTTIYKMYLVKKDVREGFIIPGFSVENVLRESGQEISSGISDFFRTPSNSEESTTNTAAPTTLTDARISDMQNRISDLSGKLSEIERDNQRFQNEEYIKIKNMFNEEKEELLGNLSNIGEFHDAYSSELQKLLKQKYDFNNKTFTANQEIQQSRVRALEEEISKLQKMNDMDSQKLNEIKSIICRSNSTKLNIHQIRSGRNPTGEFLIFLNNKCLSYEINGAEIKVKENQCDSSGSSRVNMKFQLREIKDYNEYNDAIKQEESDNKLLVMKNEDIYYPFYLVTPVNYPEKCLYVTDENIINIKTIRKSPTNRFRTSKTLGLC